MLRGDPISELRFALAEADVEDPSERLRRRVLEASIEAHAQGRGAPTEHIDGAETLRRTVVILEGLLGTLGRDEWSRPALRDLDAQGLLGHLIGVETSFLAALDGDAAAGRADHVESTQPSALGQAARDPSETLEEWRRLTAAALERAGREDPEAVVPFYGVELPLDQLLVVRAFEMWIHDEDIRRATGRPLLAPDPARLARMTDLAVALLPAGMARADRVRPGRRVRLVLTGSGGGTWDVNLDGAPDDPAPASPASPASRWDSRVIVDSTAFCRVVGNREDRAGAEAVVDGDDPLASDVFAGAAALALD